MSDELPRINVIRNRGEPNRAEFMGHTVTRQEKLWAGELGGMLPCAPYDDHFIFQVPAQIRRSFGWEHWCTCGSMAVIASPEDIKQRMWVCLFYHQRLYENGFGYHQTSVINKKDFDQIAGQTIELPKGRRWQP